MDKYEIGLHIQEMIHSTNYVHSQLEKLQKRLKGSDLEIVKTALNMTTFMKEEQANQMNELGYHRELRR